MIALKGTQARIEMLEFQISMNQEVMFQGSGSPVKATKVLGILRKIRALEIDKERKEEE